MLKNTTPNPNTLAIQIHGPSWETLKGITVDKQGLDVYLLRPKINGVTHKLICEIELKENVKIVTLRSGTVFKNETKIAVDLMIFNSTSVFTVGAQKSAVVFSSKILTFV